MKIQNLTALTILLWGIISVNAQTPPLVEQDDIQSWNDLQLTVPMSKTFDFVTQVTMRFGKNISRLNDGRFQIGFVYKPNKYWTFQPFYWYLNARNSGGQFRSEDVFCVTLKI